MSRISRYFKNHWARNYPLKAHVCYCFVMMAFSVFVSMIMSLGQLHYGAAEYWLSVGVIAMIIGPFTIIMGYIGD